ncbi:MAG: VLRF1 family aeRF1-type release factor [Ignavibacterium sp.]
MLTKKDILFIKEQIDLHKEPVLSIYADVNPAKPENLNNAWKLRIKNSLKEQDIPDFIKRKVLDVLDIEKPAAKTLALFAADDFIERYDLLIDLPVVDIAKGRVDLTWGKPNVAPLVFAIDEYERTGVLYLKKKGWKFYEIFLGELNELSDAFGKVTQQQWDELNEQMGDLYNNFLKNRVPTHPDKFPRRINSNVTRFYKQLASIIEKVISSQEIKRLILLGPDEETKFFSQFLSKSVRNIIVSFAGDLPVQDPSPARILEKVNPILEAIEREYELQLIDNISKENYVAGIEDTLDALQSGRVHLLIVPWNLNTNIWVCNDGFVSSDEEKIRTICGDDNLRKENLRNMIIDLSMYYGARLEFVRGEAEQKLLKNFNGLAGLLRW